MGTRILLADDSVTIQKVVELTFMDEDYEVLAVSNGDEAVARLDEVQPALVIADVHMPGANGYEVCRRAKQWRPGTPVLLLVGTFEPFQEDEAASAGADGHLKKPFDSQELLRRVETLLAEAGASAAAPVAAPAEELAMWAPSPAVDEPVETFGGAAPLEDSGVSFARPAPPPDEMVIERDPWAGAEEPAPAWAESAPEPLPEEPEPVKPRGAAMGVAAVAGAAVGAVAGMVAGSRSEGGHGGELSDGDVDRIARRVVELMGEKLLREVAWEVVPDMAELVIKDRIRELERQLEGT